MRDVGRYLFLLFTVVPLAEVYLLVWVGEHIGAYPTIGLVLLTGAVGAFLAKREGLRVLHNYQRTLAEGRVPAEGLLSAVLVLAGGILLIAPGLITDAVGLLLLLPPTRRAAAGVLRRRLQRMLRSGAARVTTFGFGARPASYPPRGGDGPTRPPRPGARKREDISDAEIVDRGE